MTKPAPKIRYRFDEFTLSPSTRLLLYRDREVALIPRYFDLLLLLIERRHEAVSKEEIFDTVWCEVIVSDGALTQAIRILRRSLGDSAKKPRFIRTLSRHGYRFIYEDVTEEPIPRDGASVSDAIEQLRNAKAPENEDEESRLRDAAETLLESGGIEQAESELNEVARAILRDARWDVAESTHVRLSGRAGALKTARTLIALRMRRAWPLVRARAGGAALGGVLAGIAGGLIGALVLLFGPGSRATENVLIALPMFGMIVGGLGALGVGVGLASAEALVRSYRRTALAILGALGGGLVGSIAHLIGRVTIESLFGRDLSPLGGGFEGLVLGSAIGIGYALATPVARGGMATPRGRARVLAAVSAGLLAALACLLLALTGHRLGAMSLDFMSQSFPGSQVSLDPLASLLGELTPGARTHGAISSFEGFLFGMGVVFGLTRRPRPERRQGLQAKRSAQTLDQ